MKSWMITLVAFLLFVFAHYQHVEYRVAAVKKAYAIAEAEELVKLEATIKELEGANAQLLVDKKDAENAIDDLSTALFNSLHERDSRKGTSSGDANSAAACTGAELFREDGEFLIGEAARADRVVSERDYYYRIYIESKKKLEALNGRN